MKHPKATAIATSPMSFTITEPDNMGYELGPDPDPDWVPDEIVYYKLTLNTQNPLQFGFAANSGTRPWTNQASLDSLLDDARADRVSGLKKLNWQKESAPDIRVVNKCYVILHLDPNWNWHLLPGMFALRVGDETVETYCGLRHCPDVGGAFLKPVGVPRVAPRAADICHILYFAVTDVRPAGTAADSCNLFVQFAMADNHFIPVLVDPDIKNDGGNP
jgi:hypothetical protein